jgi:hypothetical protein
MIRKIKLSESKIPRNKPARFEKTEEWRELKKILDRQALKPNEGMEVRLTEEEQQKYRITHRRSVTRCVRGYIKANHIPYQVDSYNTDGAFVVRVKYVPVLNRTA